MIKLTRPPRPDILTRNEAVWIAPLLEALTSYGTYKLIPKEEKNKLTSFYRHQDIKDSLFPSSFYKCAFCEGKPSENGNIEVEHYLPKSIYPEHIFAWENLLPACRKCNDAKLTHDTQLEPIVNPYDEDPEELFKYLDIRITPVDETPKTRRTITVCGLNSVRLMSPRASILVDLNSFSDNLEDAISEFHDAVGDRAKRHRSAKISEGIEIMERLTSSSERYAGFCRHYLKNSPVFQAAKELLRQERENS